MLFQTPSFDLSDVNQVVSSYTMEANQGRTDRLSSWLDRAATLCGLACALLGTVVLVGWYVGDASVVRLLEQYATLTYDGGLGFLSCGLGLLALVRGWRLLAIACGALAVAIGAFPLAEWFVRLDYCFDLFATGQGCRGGWPASSHVGVQTAVGFVLSGMALLLAGWVAHRALRPVLTGLISSLVAAPGMAAAIAYACGVCAASDRHSCWDFSWMSIDKAMGFWVLGAGLMFFAWRVCPHRVAGLPRWVGLSVGIFGVTLTLNLWQALLRWESAHRLQAAQSEANNLGQQIRALVEPQVLALVRMAKRWQLRGQTPKEEWESDASFYLIHYPALQAVQWVDQSLRCRWTLVRNGSAATIAADGERQRHGRAALISARRRRAPAFTRPVPLANGHVGVLVCVPILSGREVQGFFLGLFDTEVLFHTLWENGVAEGYEVAVFDGGQQIGSRLTPGEDHGRPWACEAQVPLENVTWRVRLWPSPERLRVSSSRLPEATLASGLVVTLLLVCTLYLAQAACLQATDAKRSNRRLQAEIEKRKQVEEELRELATSLEQRVAVRTRQLEASRAVAYKTMEQVQESNKKLTQAYETLELRLAAIEAANDNIMITDPDGTIEYVNPAFTRHTGYSPEAVVGRKPSILKSGKQDRRFYQQLWRTIKSGKVWRGQIVERRKDGSLYPEELSITPVRDEAGHITRFVKIGRDVTEKKRAEERLRRAHEETERLLASISSILIGIDGSGRITRWNSAAEQTFGIPAAVALGKPFQKCGIRWQDPEVPGRILQAQYTPSPTRLDNMTFRDANGRCRFLSVTVNPVGWDDQTSAGFLLLGADVTDQQIMEAQLQQARKLEAIGQLAAGIAHEINTPAQYVSDNLRFLQESWGQISKLLERCPCRQAAQDPAGCHHISAAALDEVNQALAQADVGYLLDEVPQAIEQALEGVDRIAKIVRAMKEFSHPGTKEKTPTDINQAIATTITVARNEWKYVAEVVTDFDAELPPVPCLRDEFNQVILNLIVNAAQAIGEVVDGSERKGRITISTRRQGRWAEIRISDTGCGISDEIAGRVFEPFFTTKDVGKGTGQGLALAHAVIVQKHGGRIWFQSRVGKGTTFFIRLPLEGDWPESRSEPQSIAENPSSNRQQQHRSAHEHEPDGKQQLAAVT